MDTPQELTELVEALAGELKSLKAEVSRLKALNVEATLPFAAENEKKKLGRRQWIKKLAVGVAAGATIATSAQVQTTQARIVTGANPGALVLRNGATTTGTLPNSNFGLIASGDTILNYADIALLSISDSSGVVGIANAVDSNGVVGVANGTGQPFGVWGITNTDNGTALIGEASGNGVAGLVGTAVGNGGTALAGDATGNGVTGLTLTVAPALSGTGLGNTGIDCLVTGTNSLGIVVEADGPAALAGLFLGDVILFGNAGVDLDLDVSGNGSVGGNLDVTGSLTKGGGSFKIDHPLDPANQYLYHSFVESPDMKNIYDGVVTLDGNGEAVVEMPAWFEVLNRDLRYQLTPIGAASPNLFIAQEVANGKFKIGGGASGLKVSWQVTGIRQDKWANAHRIPVEAAKPDKDKGNYLHPDLYGQGHEKQIKHTALPAKPKSRARTKRRAGKSN